MYRALLAILIASFLAIANENTTFGDPTVAVGIWVEVFRLDQNNLADYLNVRDVPSLSGKESHHLYNDYVAYVDDGPVEAEGYRWWHLEGLGWAADNWLRITSKEKIPKEPQEKILFTQFAKSSYDTFLNLINADGTNRENLMARPSQFCGSDPYTWSPDGKEIAFVNCGGTEDNPNYQINKLNIDTKEIVTLALTPGPPSGPSWSPDGKAIAFYSEIHLATEDKLESRIYVLNLETSEIIQVTDIDSSNPDWSPDGERLVFIKGGNIFVMDRDGANLNKLFDFTLIPLDECCFTGFEPSWSPTGDKITFICAETWPKDVVVLKHHFQVCTIETNGTGLNKLTSEQTNLKRLPYCLDYYAEPTPCYEPKNRFPDWSRDGKQVVFNGTIEFIGNKKGLSGDFSIFVINSDGTGFHYVTEGVDPKWQPTTVLQVPTVTPPTPTAIPPTPTQEVRFIGEEPTPILLVHGCGGSAADWEETGWVSNLSLVETYTELLPFTEIYLYQTEGSIFGPTPVFSLDYHLSSSSIQETAKVIPKALDSIKEITGETQVIVITHSMGAILTRYYLEDFLDEKSSERSDIGALLMIAPPNNGSFWINLGFRKIIDLLNLQCAQASELNSKDLKPLNSKPLPNFVRTYQIAAGNQCWFIFIGFNDCVVTVKDARIRNVGFEQYSAIHSDLLPAALEQTIFPELTPILEHPRTVEIAVQMQGELSR